LQLEHWNDMAAKRKIANGNRLFLIAAAFAGISVCVLLTCNSRELPAEDDHASDARWANEGGANPPPGV
jgi:hypothetical protein